jgi:hypothetical protein
MGKGFFQNRLHEILAACPDEKSGHRAIRSKSGQHTIPTHGVYPERSIGRLSASIPGRGNLQLAIEQVVSKFH